jgi:hypothetical protein
MNCSKVYVDKYLFNVIPYQHFINSSWVKIRIGCFNSGERQGPDLRRKHMYDAACGNESQKEETARGSCHRTLIGSGAKGAVWGCRWWRSKSEHIQLSNPGRNEFAR